ncbi:MAG: polysaccharide deacetylase family protein [Bryobacterales bacterium]|nr:polysaccharide deacetylase family protein [Bryobacterales bacterium]
MIASVAAGVAAAAAAIGVAGAWATRGRSSQIFGPSIWHGDRSRKVIALTFDDGPTKGTRQLLEALDRYQVKATFFQIGRHAGQSPEIAREVSKAGHEIGNHTYNHLALWLKPSRTVESEISRAQTVLTAIHGTAPRWFRAPYGVRWFGLSRSLSRHGLTGVMWTTIARDWALPAGEIVKRLEGGIANGAIYCLHDGRGTRDQPDIRPTVEAVKALVPILKGQGYEFGTVTQILGRPNRRAIPEAHRH